ncbi:MAG: hypothetical protein IIA14_01805 [SAR324 cluster bacterium]|nr:hypothetical protein [SAR324 cluster bacterium]
MGDRNDESVTEDQSQAPEPAHHPDHIGPYRILEPLGEGGMGTVYLAEQSEPVRRRVALKLIKLGMDSKQVIARFELERQALDLLKESGQLPALMSDTDDYRSPEINPHAQGSE